jgi:ADP-ribosyl-[dinitrogen reductase] hydrolase
VPNLTRADRIAGCLLAGALGDAIGSYFEGRPATSDIVMPVDLRVSDDTQLTIATCESIVETRTVNPTSIANHFVRWFRDRRISGIGSSTLKSLTELDAGGHWAMVGATGERSAGNGAAMRVAPLAFVLDPDRDTDRQTIRDICRITHRNDEAYIGALAIVRSIRHVVEGNPLNDDFLWLLINSLPDSLVRDRLIDVRDSSLSIGEYVARFASSGYVVDSVPLAILAAIRASDFLATIEQIVQCGRDTDTIASMFGNIFGAAFGTGRLPMEFVNQIDAVSLVRETAANFSLTSIAT